MRIKYLLDDICYLRVWFKTVTRYRDSVPKVLCSQITWIIKTIFIFYFKIDLTCSFGPFPPMLVNSFACQTHKHIHTSLVRSTNLVSECKCRFFSNKIQVALVKRAVTVPRILTKYRTISILHILIGSSLLLQLCRIYTIFSKIRINSFQCLHAIYSAMIFL